jgi:hypothetical protein
LTKQYILYTDYKAILEIGERRDCKSFVLEEFWFRRVLDEKSFQLEEF